MRRTLEEFLAYLDTDRAAISVCETNRLETHEVTVCKTRVQVIQKENGTNLDRRNMQAGLLIRALSF